LIFTFVTFLLGDICWQSIHTWICCSNCDCVRSIAPQRQLCILSTHWTPVQSI